MHYRHYSRLLCACRPLARHASTSTSQPFPFPNHGHPTPHQIFHLPYGASQQDIKARYFDLVKIYHPDSARCRDTPANVRHARFQSITQAYDVLRGKAISRVDHWNDPVRAELERRRRHGPATHGYPHSRAYADGSRGFAYEAPWTDDGLAGRARKVENWNDQWKDKIIICMAVLAVGAAVFPALMYAGPAQVDRRHRSAAANLAAARAEAREYGQERREGIRRRVQEMKDKEQRGEDPHTSSRLELSEPGSTNK